MGKRELNLYIAHGDEYRSRVGSIYEEDTFFRKSYLQAGKCVKEIIAASRRFDERTTRNQYDGDCGYTPTSPHNELALSLHSELASYPNNIIAFCGHRGQGKTSAMVSFSKALETLHLMQQNPQVKNFWTECVEQESDWGKWEFIVVDPVDPTSMEQTDSILRILLSRLFIKVQKAYEDQKGITWRQDQLDQLMNHVMEDFRDCYKALDTLKEKRQDDYYYDDLSSLADLGDSSCMKQKMNRLVKDCCKFLRPAEDRKKMLVLQLDDTDLNAQHAYEILEDIRKYLVIPGVIILMATEMTQLSLIVEQHFVREFKEIIAYSDRQLDPQDTLNRMNCHNSAENYIGKLFPSMHQIHLPALDEVICGAYSKLSLHYQDENQKDLLVHDSTNENSEYQTVLINCIYEKTRIVLLEPKSYLHNLLPSSMRQLTHFLTVLHEMSDIDPEVSLHQMIHSHDNKSKAQKRKLLHNLELLSGYFRHVWCPIHLTTLENMEMQKIFTASSSSLHQQAMLSLKKIERKARGDEGKDQDSGQRYLYSDVLEQLYALRQCEDRERFYKICFAVQFYYTLYNYQNLITEKVKLVSLQALATMKKPERKNFFLSWSAPGIQVLSGDKSDVNNFLLRGCLARVKGQEGAVEPFQMDRIQKYETIQFDPQYLLFPSRITELRADALMADGGEVVEHQDMPSEEKTELTTQPEQAETPPKYQLQPDASLIYWATPSLQYLFTKATGVAYRHTVHSDPPQWNEYCEALNQAVRDFKERLEGKTKKLQLTTGFPLHEGSEMYHTLQMLYGHRIKEKEKLTNRRNRPNRARR